MFKTEMTLSWLATCASGLMLAACSQAPAPVVDGYANQELSNHAQIMENYAKYGSFTDRVSHAEGKPVLPQNLAATATPTSSAEKLALSKPLLLAPGSVQEENLGTLKPTAGTDAPPVVKPILTRPLGQPTGRPVITTTAQQVKQPITEMQTVKQDVHYTVQPGDSVYKLARQYKVTPQQIFSANKLATNANVTTGQVLVIPDQLTKVAVLQKVSEGQLQARLDGMNKIQPAAGEAPTEVQQNEQITAADGTAYVNHKVGNGETIFRISQQYHASVLDIMAANDLQTPQQLQSGMTVKVPLNHGKPMVAGNAPANGEKKIVVADNTPAPSTSGSSSSSSSSSSKSGDKGDDGDDGSSDSSDDDDNVVAKAPKPLTALDEAKAQKLRGHVDVAAAHANGLAWPVQGTVIRRFGEQGNGVMHTGINIQVAENTPVLATEEGNVIYAGNGLKSYGEIVLLRHPDGMVSAYAHNNQLLVQKGDSVKKGQVIALSGATGNVDKPQLHFEIRRAARAIDPLKMLASR